MKRQTAAAVAVGLALAAAAGLGQTVVRVAGPNRAVSQPTPAAWFSVTTNACRLYGVQAFNHSAGDLFLLIWDRKGTTNAVTGQVPSLPAVQLYGGMAGGWDWPQGRVFTNGVFLSVSTSPRFQTNSGVNLTNVTFDAQFHESP